MRRLCLKSSINALLAEYNTDPQKYSAISVHTLRADGHADVACSALSIEHAQAMLETTVPALKNLKLGVFRQDLHIPGGHWLGWGLVGGLLLAKGLSKFTTLFQ